MNDWRAMAIHLFPVRASEFADSEETPGSHTVFFCLGMDWHHAALTRNEQLASKIIEYTEWALGQTQDQKLREVADVSFLEHIADDDRDLELAEQLFPATLYERALGCSAVLKRNVAAWAERLAASRMRYRALHG